MADRRTGLDARSEHAILSGLRSRSPRRAPGGRLPRRGRGVSCACSALATAFALVAGPAFGQAPENNKQDELDLQGGSSVVVGSGARALGMGGAFLARADDATAASWNPAGLSYLRRPEVSLVGARNAFDATGRAPDGSLVRSDTFLGYAPDFMAVAVPIALGETTGAVQLSFQRTFSNFDGARDIESPPNPPFHLEGSDGFDVLAFGTGIQLSRALRVGVTLNRWVNGFHQTRERLLRRRSIQEVNFDLSGWNLNLGLIWTPVESLNLGLVGKTPFTGKVRLTRSRRDFESDPNGGPDLVTSNAFSSDAVRLDFPGALGVGISWRPWSQLTLSADYTRTFWSGGRVRNYFVLANEGNPLDSPTTFFQEVSYPSLGEDQVDTEQIRVGAEYVVLHGRLKWPLRMGYFNDRQYFRVDGAIPRFNGFTAGTGIGIGPVLLDVAYVRESGRSESSLGVTSHRVERFVVSMIYRHEGR
jgi:long-chain fatty acid transport protein